MSAFFTAKLAWEIELSFHRRDLCSAKKWAATCIKRPHYGLHPASATASHSTLEPMLNAMLPPILLAGLAVQFLTQSRPVSKLRYSFSGYVNLELSKGNLTMLLHMLTLHCCQWCEFFKGHSTNWDLHANDRRVNWGLPRSGKSTEGHTRKKNVIKQLYKLYNDYLYPVSWKRPNKINK